MASLNRKQWEEMWSELMKIKMYYNNSSIHHNILNKMRIEIDKDCQEAIEGIKNKIESVIGQME